MHRDNAGRIGSAVNRKRIALTAKVFAFAVLGMMCFGRWALADVDSGITAFRESDYASAVKELHVPAFDGHPIAQYYLGVMHAEGLGVTRSPPDALKWFLCAEAGSLPGALKSRALEWRRRLYAEMSLLEMDYAEKSAAKKCRVAEPMAVFDRGYRQHEVDEAVPRRSGAFAVLLFPGDVTMRGVLVVFDQMGSKFMTEAAMKAVEAMGDVLFGLLALLGWLLIARVGYLTVHHFWEKFLERLPVAFGSRGYEQASQHQGQRPDRQ